MRPDLPKRLEQERQRRLRRQARTEREWRKRANRDARRGAIIRWLPVGPEADILAAARESLEAYFANCVEVVRYDIFTDGTRMRSSRR